MDTASCSSSTNGRNQDGYAYRMTSGCSHAKCPSVFNAMPRSRARSKDGTLFADSTFEIMDWVVWARRAVASCDRPNWVRMRANSVPKKASRDFVGSGAVSVSTAMRKPSPS